jgi:hypothetical protein
LTHVSLTSVRSCTQFQSPFWTTLGLVIQKGHPTVASSRPGSFESSGLKSFHSFKTIIGNSPIRIV